MWTGFALTLLLTAILLFVFVGLPRMALNRLNQASVELKTFDISSMEAEKFR